MNQNERFFDDVSTDVPLPFDATPEFDTSPDKDQVPANLHRWRHPIANRGADSAIKGLAGLAMLIVVLCGSMPVVFDAAEVSTLFNANPPIWLVCGTVMALYLPSLNAATFIVTAVMLWHVSLIQRFIVAISIYSLGASSWLIVMIGVYDLITLDDFLDDLGLVLPVLFISSATVGILFQLFTPWTLTHWRVAGNELPRLGIRNLIELTTIVAVSFAFISILNFDVTTEMMTGIAVLAVYGALGSLAGICSSMVFLRNDRASTRGLITNLAAACVFSFVVVVSFYAMDSGWNVAMDRTLVTIALTIFGALIICVINAMCVYWLRRCGWRCVKG